MAFRRGRWLVLTLTALAYPVVPFGHLTDNSSEIADRSAAFIFGGVAYVVSIWWFRQLRTQHGARRSLSNQNRLRPTVALVLGLTFCFVGGGIIGDSDWAYTPGRYMVIANNRSIDQLALAAGSWEAANIKQGSRAVGDRDNDLVSQAYAGLDVVTAEADHVDGGAVNDILLRYLAPSDIDTICADHVQYLISDVRLSTSLPELGIYIDQGEYRMALVPRHQPSLI